MLIALKPRERVVTDGALLADADAQALQPVLDMMEEATRHLSRTLRCGDAGVIRGTAGCIGTQADRLNLHRVARVARTVVVLSDGEDVVALAANVARLRRLARRALSDIAAVRDDRS